MYMYDAIFAKLKVPKKYYFQTYDALGYPMIKIDTLIACSL
jgi:hypothetical protein